jgi:hypothetical protein
MFTPDQHLGDRAAKFAVSAARSMARQSHKVHTDPALRNAEGRSTGFNGARFVWWNAVVTTAITPCSGNTLGKGKVQKYVDDLNTGTLAPDPQGDDGAGNCDCFNWYQNSGTVGAGAHCKVMSGPNGLELWTWDC